LAIEGGKFSAAFAAVAEQSALDATGFRNRERSLGLKCLVDGSSLLVNGSALPGSGSC
jgi:hypothetical protein